MRASLYFFQTVKTRANARWTRMVQNRRLGTRSIVTWCYILHFWLMQKYLD